MAKWLTFFFIKHKRILNIFFFALTIMYRPKLRQLPNDFKIKLKIQFGWINKYINYS